MPLIQSNEYWSWQPAGLTSSRLTVEQKGVSLGGLGDYGGGELALYVPDAVTQPTVAPASGFILRSKAGVPWVFESNGSDGPLALTRTGSVSVNFGTTTPDTSATTTVVGQAWVTASSVIDVEFTPAGSVDHPSTDPLFEGCSVVVSNLVAGVGFDVTVYSPNRSLGAYAVTWISFG